MESFIKYFVSFSHINNGDIGFGCMEVSASKRIENMKDINEVKRSVEMNLNAENVVILHYREF